MDGKAVTSTEYFRYAESLLYILFLFGTFFLIVVFAELELILFQHSCYNRNEFAKVTIDNFYTMRAHTSEFFRNRNPKVPPAENIFIL